MQTGGASGFQRWPLRALTLLWLAAAAADGANASDVAPFSEADARTFASLAQAAYCSKTPGGRLQLTAWTCEPCEESGLHALPGSVRVVQAREIFESNATAAYVARLVSSRPRPAQSDLGEGCLLSVRGSTLPANWAENLKFWKEPVPLEACVGCKVEHGFADIWIRIQPKILAALADLGCSAEGATSTAEGAPHSADWGRTNSLFVTGHSMGAAVGTLAMFALENLGFRVRSAFLFESPRVGNGAFAARFDETFSAVPVWRITNNFDPIPQMPPWMLGYRHVGQQVHFDREGKYHLCEGPADPLCYVPSLPQALAHSEDHCASTLTPNGQICGCGANSPSIVVV